MPKDGGSTQEIAAARVRIDMISSGDIGILMRTLVDIPAEDIAKLDALAVSEKRSRAAEIRDAIRMYLARKTNSRDWIERGAGYWKDREDIGDGVEYQRAMREDRSRC